MKFLTNLIANKDCLGDYCDREKLNNFLSETSLDGYEVICAGDYPAEIDNSKVIGLHLPFFNAWMDLYKGDFAALDKEYGSKEVWQQITILSLHKCLLCLKNSTASVLFCTQAKVKFSRSTKHFFEKSISTLSQICISASVKLYFSFAYWVLP